jgi:hypothetical protein
MNQWFTLQTSGATPLFMTILRGNMDVVRDLLDAGATVNLARVCSGRRTNDGGGCGGVCVVSYHVLSCVLGFLRPGGRWSVTVVYGESKWAHGSCAGFVDCRRSC